MTHLALMTPFEHETSSGKLELAKPLAVLLMTCSFIGMSAVDAEAQEACSSYTVVRGDTLSEIARKASLQGGYQYLFDANVGVLSSPNLLEVGQVLVIPCLDGRLPGVSEPEVVAIADLDVQEPIAIARAARFLTGSGYAPFTDENLPGGGMITQMVARSMELGNPEQDYEVIFVNDWGAHLTDLLPSGAFDLGFPWYLPDCSKVSLLSEANANRCTSFDASEPFYEAVVGYYTLTGSSHAGAESYADLFGATLCRPDGWYTFDLEAEGLVTPNIQMVSAASEEVCWQMLEAGDVEVITYEALAAEEDFDELGLTGRITEVNALASKVTTHVFTPKDNPNGEAYLEVLNAGLEELRLSGEWFEIVRGQIKATLEN